MHGGARKGAGRKPICPQGERVDACSFRICAGLHERLKAWCKAHGTEKSAVINALVTAFLNRQETK